jgi:hypothetical protein
MIFIAAFILALLISLVFAMRNRNGSSWIQLTLFFFILFMAGVAGQFWIIPFGPVWQGVSWLPLLFIMLIVTLLFAAPLPGHRHTRVIDKKPDETVTAVVAISVFFWLLLFVLLIAVIAGYAKRSNKVLPIPEKPEIASHQPTVS